MADRTILHCDLNSFFASVELAENPQITAKYVAVSGNPTSRHGIILAKNTAAKEAGVKTGEAIWQAKSKCPELVCLEPHYDLYVQYSHAAREVYRKYTDYVENFGMDECWLDVTSSGIFGSGEEIAEKIRREIRETLGVTVSVGVSFCKIFAKLGSDMKKPDATTVLSRGNFKQKVWPLAVSEMLFIGNRTERKLNSLNIFTIGDLANAKPDVLEGVFGVNGLKMWRAARGEDNEPVHRDGEDVPVKSVGHGTTTLRDLTTFDEVDTTIEYLSEMVATRLRRYGLKASVVHLDLRMNDLSHVSRQRTVAQTFVSGDIIKCAKQLLREIWHPKRDLPLRTVTVSTAGLAPVGETGQTSLFDVHDEKREKLEFTIDQIRKKYGFDAIARADLKTSDFLSNKTTAEEDLLPFKRK